MRVLQRRKGIVPIEMASDKLGVEERLRQYFAAFNGTNKDFTEVEDLFEELYDKDFTMHHNGFILGRNMVKRLHKEYMSRGTKATIIHYRYTLGQYIDVKYHAISNGDKNEDREDFILHMIYSVQDNKLISSRSLNGRSYQIEPVQDPLFTIAEEE